MCHAEVVLVGSTETWRQINVFSVKLVNIKIMTIMMEVVRKLKNVRYVVLVIMHQKNWNSPISKKYHRISSKFALNLMTLGNHQIVTKCVDGI